MGQCTLDLFAGLGVSLAPATNQTIRWWSDRRIQTIRASASGLNMTLEAPDLHRALPWGGPAIVIVNPKDATNAFNLRQIAFGTPWTISVAIGQLVEVYRVNSGGLPQWWPSVYTIL